LFDFYQTDYAMGGNQTGINVLPLNIDLFGTRREIDASSQSGDFPGLPSAYATPSWTWVSASP
jgi:hypothetical protein